MKKTEPTGHLVHETDVTILGEGVVLEGDLRFSGVTRVYGTLRGRISAAPGSSIILMETAVVEGDLDVDSLVIAGFVRGTIRASGRVSIEGTGRVIGNVDTKKIAIEFGAYLEGETRMQTSV
jgi:cytoskeletal protein CcmA (bactofilin family)